jgi:hypothetical protein
MSAATITQPVPPVAVPPVPAWATEWQVRAPSDQGDPWQVSAVSERNTGAVDTLGDPMVLTVLQYRELVEGEWDSDDSATAVEVLTVDLAPEQLRRLGQAMVALADELTGGAA